MGRYIGSYFVSTYQKISNFRIDGEQKQGGNVASYFCLPSGMVLHAIAGPVNAATFLQEARWVVENRKLSQLVTGNDRQRALQLFRKLHADRLQVDHHVHLNRSKLPALGLAPRPLPVLHAVTSLRGQPLTESGQVHLLLAVHPLPHISQVYGIVFQNILGQRISTAPVVVAAP